MRSDHPSSSILTSDHPFPSTLTNDTVVFSLQAQSDLPMCGEKEEGGDRVYTCLSAQVLEQE